MKIGIQTWGSNGDVRPMIALAKGLQEANHHVTLIVSSIDNKNYRKLCDRYQIKYTQVPDRIDFDMEDFAHRSFKMNPVQWLKALFDEVFLPYENEIYQAAKALVEHNDLVIGHHVIYPLKIAALKLNVPFVSVTLCQAAIPTLNSPPFRLPNLGPMLNRVQWQLFNGLLNLILKRRFQKLWLAEQLPLFDNVASDLFSSDLLNLVAVDPVFCSDQSGWKDCHQVTGFFNLSESTQDWTTPESLQQFLQSGEKPVYFTFGSLQQAVPDWSMDLFVKAVQQAGCRALIQTSMPQRFPVNSQLGNIYFLGTHPHVPVFRHCAAVVHHGGAGTTQTATMVGLPSIVVPFMDEQLFWGKQLQLKGVAPEPIPAKTVNADKLTNAIRYTLQSDELNHNASLLGHQLRDTDGVGNAIKLINRRVNLSVSNSILC